MTMSKIFMGSPKLLKGVFQSSLGFGLGVGYVEGVVWG